jgi:MFS family permease
MSTIRRRIAGLAADLPPSFWYLWFGTIVNRLGGFVLPFLALYLTAERGMPIGEAGLMVSLFGAGSFASQLTGGELSDRLGRRPVLLLSLLVTPAVTIVLGLAQSVLLIAAATLIMGFFTDLYRPAVSASVADLVSPESRLRAYGYMYWAINLGAGIAPILAGLMAHLSYFLLFAGDALTTLLYGFIVFARVPESQPAEATHAARVALSRRLRQIGREPLLLVFSGLAFLTGLIYMQGFVTLPLAMRADGLGPLQYGLAIAANGILIVFITIQLTEIVGRWPRFTAMAVSALFVGLGFGMNWFAHSLLAYGAGIVMWTLGEIISAAIAPTIIADLAPVEMRGTYQGIFGSSFGLSFFFGPLLGGLVFQHYGAGLWLACAALGALLVVFFLALSRPAHARLARARQANI